MTIIIKPEEAIAEEILDWLPGEDDDGSIAAHAAKGLVTYLTTTEEGYEHLKTLLSEARTNGFK